MKLDWLFSKGRSGTVVERVLPREVELSEQELENVRGGLARAWSGRRGAAPPPSQGARMDAPAGEGIGATS